MENEIKEVYFNLYCHQCEYKDNPESEEPCSECLKEGSNLWSHKPVYFKEKTDASK